MFDSIEEIAAALPPAGRLHLALPASAVLFERMRLPSIEPAELEGMVQLQLEKTLPFAAEDVTSSFEVVEQTEKESVVLAVVANNEQIDALCQPLRNKLRLPEKVTLFTKQLVALCPKDLLVLLIYQEQEKFVVAISESGKAGFAQTVAAPDVPALLAEMPQLLLSAEMDRVPTTFARVQLDNVCADAQSAVGEFFGLPVDLISMDAASPESDGNLAPVAWQAERKRLHRGAQIKTRLIIAGAAYLTLLLCGFGYLFWLHGKVTKLDRQIREVQPQLEFIRTRKVRWLGLAPAIDPARYTVELLLQIMNSRHLASDEIHITQFDQTKDQFMIEGEAPNANVVVELSEQLKKNTALGDFKIESGPPTLLPNEHAQFRIFGKL